MTKTYDNNKTLLICLIIALLLHILVSLSLFIKHENSTNSSLEKKQETIDKLKELLSQKQEISSLKPSPYSAPVVYYDEDELQEPQPQQQQQPEKQETKTQEQEKQIVKAEIKEPKPIEKEIKAVEKPVEKLKEKKQEITTKKNTLQDRVKIIEQKTEELKKKIAQKVEQAKKAQAQKKPAAKPVTKKEVSNEPKIMNAKISAQPRQQTSAAYVPNLANLTQSFVQYMNEEGNNQFLERKGNSDKFNPHEAKMVSYYNKVISFFHRCARPQLSTFSNLVENYMSLNPGAGKIEVGLKLIINKDGSLAEIMLTQNSGFNPYDNHIIKIFQEAAPFPPVPDHLSKDELIFPINIYTPLERQGFTLRIG